MTRPPVPTQIRKVFDGRVFSVTVESITLPRGDRLEAAVVAARAVRATRFDDRVPDLTGQPQGAAMEHAVEHDRLAPAPSATAFRHDPRHDRPIRAQAATGQAHEARGHPVTRW